MPEISIKDMGPVVEFEYDMAEPGLHVLKGSHGAGKTTILRTVQMAAGEKPEVKPGKADGSKRGEATIAGKTLKISRKTREEGELEVEGMGDLNIATLHNPGHKTAATRDKYRIATLVRLAGGTAALDAFRALLTPEQWAEIVDEDMLPEDADPVEMAAKIKRQIDAAAKGIEDFASGAESGAAALKETAANLIAEAVAAGGVPNEAGNLGERQRAHEAAIAERQRLANQQRDAERCKESAKQARERIEQARKEYDGPTSEAAEVASATVHKQLAEHRDAVEEYRKALELAEKRLEALNSEVDVKAAEFKAALNHEETLTKWEEQLAADAVAPVPVTDMDAAEAAVMAAAVAVTMHNAETAAATHRDNADGLIEKAKSAKKKAEKLREAAAATSGVLSQAIATIPDCPLFVTSDDDGETRLVIKTDRNADKPEPFDELSDGERWKVIVPLCCGAGRLVVLPQAAYGELAPSTRAMLHALAAERGAYILSAQCDDGELRGERYAGE
jgi:tetratricopeptide (TPR) repeat protein